MKRKLYTYVVYVGEAKLPDDHTEITLKKCGRIGWRKTAKQACDFAASLVELKSHHPDYPQVVIVRRDRKPGDFSY